MDELHMDGGAGAARGRRAAAGRTAWVMPWSATPWHEVVSSQHVTHVRIARTDG
ncbi:MAG: hypothetical protein V9G12_24875 [Microthrixaceae bacterium]